MAAKGPGTSRSVGKVGVDVVPDTSKFREDLEAQLAKELAKVKANVNVGADTTKAKEDIEQFRRELEARNIHMDVELDVQQSKVALAQLEKSLSGMNGKVFSIDVGLDLGDIRSMQKAIKSLGEDGFRVERLAKDMQFLETSMKKMNRASGSLGKGLSWVTKSSVFLDRMGVYAGRASAAFFQWAGNAGKVTKLLKGFGKIGVAATSSVAKASVQAARGFLALGQGIMQYGLKPLAVVTKIGMKIATIGFAAGTALAGIAKLSALLVQMGGILIEAPAAFATLAAVVGVIALGIDGIKKAFESFPKLIEPLRKSLSNIFEKTMGPGVKALADGINKLKPGLSSLASGIGNLFTSFAKAFNQPKVLAQWNDSLKNMGGFFNTLRGAVAPLVQALSTLVNVGTKGMGSFAQTLVDLTNKFNNFIQKAAASGQLQEWIHTAVEAFKTLGKGGLGVFKFLMETFKALQPAFSALTPLFSALGSVISKSLAPILSDLVVTLGPAFTEIINAIGAALDVARPGIQAFAQGFANFIRALAPAMPAIGKLVSVLGDQLGKALTVLGPVIADIATVFSEQLAAVLPELIPPLVDIAKALGDMLIALAPMIKPLSDVATVILKAFADILVKIGPPLADFVTQIVNELAPYLPDLVTAFINLSNAVLPLLQPMLDLTVKVFQVLAPLLGPIADIMQVIADILTPLAAGLGLIIDGISTVLGGLGDVVGGVSDFVSDAGFAVLGFVTNTDYSMKTGLQHVKGHWDETGKFIKTSSDGLVQHMVSGWLGMPEGVKPGMDNLKKGASDAFGGMTESAARENAKVQIIMLELFGKKVPQSLRDVASGAKSAFGAVSDSAKTGASGAKTAIKGMVDSTKGWLDGLSSSTYGSGDAATRGFANGMSSQAALASVARAAGRVVQTARDYFPASPAKEGPFSGHGWTPYSGIATVEGFAQGMISAAPAAAKAAQTVMAAVSSPFEQGFDSVNGFIDNTSRNLQTKFGEASVDAKSVVTATSDPANFVPVAAQIEQAISGWGVDVKVDQKAVGKMVRKDNVKQGRRS